MRTAVLILVFLILLSSFFNYILSLYSEVDLFRIDLPKGQGKEKDGKISKLDYILKNIFLFRVSVSLLQLIFGSLISSFINSLIDMYLSKTIYKNITSGFWKYPFSIFQGLFLLFFTDIFPSNLVRKYFTREKVLSYYYLEPAYLTVVIFSWLKLFIKPKNKIFINNEEDIVRFVINLGEEGTLKKEEVLMVKKALAFDETNARLFIFPPERKIISLNEKMDYLQIQDVYFKHFFTNYPVFNEEGILIGVFNYNVFSWARIKEKDVDWKNYLTEALLIPSSAHLNEIFDLLQSKNSQIAFIRENNSNRVIGLVTIKDILSTLVGKINDEREQIKSLKF